MTTATLLASGGGSAAAAGAELTAGGDSASLAVFARRELVDVAALAPELAALAVEPVTVLAQGPIGRPPIDNVPRAQASSIEEPPIVIVVEVTVNGTASGQLLTMDQYADGRYAAIAEELRALRIKLPPFVQAREKVELSDYGIAVQYDEPRQKVSLDVPLALLETHNVELGGRNAEVNLDAVKPTPGFVANYSLYGSIEAGSKLLSGNTELLALTRIGVFSSSTQFSLAQGASGSNGSFTRLDTSFRHIDPVAIRSVTLGDFNSNALAWNGSVRMAGLQIASAFEQRPDLVTTPLPEFSGAAVLPSTLDLYVGQQRVYSGEVPSGPFDLKSLPSMAGGNVRLVATDITGRQVEITKSYYFNPMLLRKGLLQYSIDAGVPRLDYGTKSFSYDKVLFLAGSARYGINDLTTVDAHAEASTDGLVNLGGGLSRTVAGFAAVTGSAAYGSYDGNSGWKFSARADATVLGARLYAASEWTSGDYFDLSRVSIRRNAYRYGAGRGDLARTADATRLDRFGLSFQPWFDKTSINLSYNRIKSGDRDTRTASASLSRSLGRRISVFANGFADLDDSRNYGMFFSLNFQLGDTGFASAGVDNSGGRIGYSLQASGNTSQRQGSIGWTASRRQVEDASPQHSASASYRAPFALLRGQVDEVGGALRGSLSADGSLVVAGGGMFPANRIGQSFAIVRNAGPHSMISQSGVTIGKANGNGRALLPDLIPFYETEISLDPTTLPDGLEPAFTSTKVTTGYRQGSVVDFGVRAIHGAVVIIRDWAGKAIEPGYLVELEGGDSAVMGYGGEVYLRGLNGSNRISINRGPLGICSATFSYNPNATAQPKIGPLTCQ